MLNSKQAAAGEFLESLTSLGRKLRAVFNSRVTSHGLTYARARVLLSLAARPALTQKDLAHELELATTGRLLDTMEKFDLIERVDHPHDRRAKQIVLTEEGAAKARLVVRITDQIRSEICADILEADFDRVTAILKAIDRSVGASGNTSTQTGLQ